MLKDLAPIIVQFQYLATLKMIWVPLFVSPSFFIYCNCIFFHYTPPVGSLNGVRFKSIDLYQNICTTNITTSIVHNIAKAGQPWDAPTPHISKFSCHAFRGSTIYIIVSNSFLGIFCSILQPHHYCRLNSTKYQYCPPFMCRTFFYMSIDLLFCIIFCFFCGCNCVQTMMSVAWLQHSFVNFCSSDPTSHMSYSVQGSHLHHVNMKDTTALMIDDSKRPKWMRQKAFVPCNCKRCFFCRNHLTGP